MTTKPPGIARPSNIKASAQAEAEAIEGTRRLAIDLPTSMHRKLKLRATTQDRTIRDYVMALIARDLFESD